MKKFMKKEVIIAFIIGVILTSSIAVYASTINAKDIDYKNGQKVSEALDYLYSKASTTNTNSSNICFSGVGRTWSKSWTSGSYLNHMIDDSVCTLSGTAEGSTDPKGYIITFQKDCNITMETSTFAGRSDKGSANTCYFRVFVNDSVVYTSSGNQNALKNYTPLSNYDISKDSTIYIQVYGTDTTNKIHSVSIKLN